MTLRSLMAPLAGLLLATTYTPAQAEEDGPRVSVAQGALQGVSGEGIESFLGVPFAAPPAGDLRWRAPQPVESWDGVRLADQVGADCVQDLVNNPPGPDHDNVTSEDCLYLNIWRPAGVTEDQPLPVMVWIHGGAFIMGSASVPGYRGDDLARKGVIVVGLNYRLGRFGTFVVPELLDEQVGQPLGNYGLLDQIAALKWVQDNIASFGGDAGNVTIFGESAGASSVNFLMTSPLARGLFDKAIAQSGGESANLPDMGQSLRDSVAWAESKGIADADLDALRALPAEVVLDAPVTSVAYPFVDGQAIVESTPEAFEDGLASPVPYLLGANNYEESLMVWLPGAGDAMVKRLGDDASAVIDLYREPGEDNKRAVERMWGEAAMTLPARSRAQSFSAQGNSVWLYRYSYVPEALRSTVPGAGHEWEIEMVFNHPYWRSRDGWTQTDAAMADLISDYWVSFARTGNPNHSDAPDWQPCRPDQDRLMEFTYDGAVLQTDFAKERLDALQEALFGED